VKHIDQVYTTILLRKGQFARLNFQTKLTSVC